MKNKNKIIFVVSNLFLFLSLIIALLFFVNSVIFQEHVLTTNMSEFSSTTTQNANFKLTDNLADQSRNSFNSSKLEILFLKITF